MVSVVQLGLRSLQFLLALLTLALIGNVIAEAFAGNQATINYAMFTAVISMLVVIFGIVGVFVESLAVPIALMIADGIALFATWIAGIVLAAKLGVHSCGNQSYVTSNSLTNGSHNPSKRCHELQASTAFFWFLFAAFAASVFFDFAGRNSGIARGGLRKGGPSMTQV